MKRYLLGTILFASLSVSPALLKAQDPDRHDHPAVKVYVDRTHHDKHEWNDAEVSAWGRYRDERHVKVTDFAKANRSQQQAYWNWRHDHPDTH